MNLPDTMHAMVLEAPGMPLVEKLLPLPLPSPQQVLVKIIACGVCRTDLHIVDGELKHPKLPLIPGHEIVGTVVRTGNSVSRLKEGDMVGIPWLGYTICSGIHMSDIPSFPYSSLWEERIIRSVANLTRQDGDHFLKLAPEIPVQTETVVFPLNQANKALESLRNGRILGAAVLTMTGT